MSTAARDDAVDALQQAVDAGTTPGYVLAAGRGPDTELTAFGGSAELQPRQRPVREETVFDVASLTKVAATLPIVLRLIARGELALDAAAGEILDGLAQPQITIEQLLTHSAGFPPEPTREAPDPAALRARIIATPLAAAPGSVVTYSDVGFLVLGWIAETIAGQPLDALFAAEVAEPLGLRVARFGPPAGPAFADDDVVAATEPRPDGTPVRGSVHDETAAALDGPAGHAGLFSDAADLAAYAAAWTDPGDDWLPRSLRTAATADRTAGVGDGSGHRGLGWTARGDRFDQLGDAWPDSGVFHSGFTGTSLSLDPVSGRWIVLLTNDVHLGRGRGLINPLRRAVNTALAP